ncbi:MAG: PIG-L family deacetylase [Chloroflexota bacterium]
MPEVLSLMCVHAHPDDECFSTGGTLAKYADEHALTSLITATRGEVGEIRDPRLVIASYQTLGQVRTKELSLATSVLKVNFVNFLGYRDSGMAGSSDNLHTSAFANANLDEACQRLVLNIRKLRPQVLVTYDEQGGYGHPDHIMCNRVTQEAFYRAGDPEEFWDDGEEPWQPSKLYYIAQPRSRFQQGREAILAAGLDDPFPGRDPNRFGLPDEAITTRIDVSQYLEQKRQALQCHRSQTTGTRWLSAPAAVLLPLLGEECFTRVVSAVDTPDREDDLFAGLRDHTIAADDYSLSSAQPVGTHFVA